MVATVPGSGGIYAAVEIRFDLLYLIKITVKLRLRLQKIQ